MEYDINDEDLYHEFRKCVFARQLRSGLYKFVSKTGKDYMYYRIRNKSYAGSYGEMNGTEMRIMMDV